METITRCVLVLLFLYCFHEANTQNRRLEAIPERFERIFVNEKYLSNVTSNVRRKDRNTGYVFNLAANFNYPFDNNVSFHLVYYEYLHNEYRRSFIELHYHMCDLINKDPHIGSILRRSGVVCPVPAGFNSASLRLYVLNFPSHFPFERCMIQLTFLTEPEHELLFKGNIYLKFKQTLLNNLKKETK